MAGSPFIAEFKLAKTQFFDREVAARLEPFKKKTLTTFGRYTRRDAKSSMKKYKKGKPSKPGQPPKVRRGQIKRFLFYVFDEPTESVVIGPTYLASKKSTTVPAMLEYGKGKLAKRPFMQPAYKKNIPKLPQIIEDAS